jgi:hypothetical protein
MEIIQIDETTRIRHMDAKNWTVETYRECKAKDGTSSRPRACNPAVRRHRAVVA